MTDPILVTGGTGLVGRYLVEHLTALGYSHVVAPDSSACDLTNRRAVADWFERVRPAYVFHLAGHVRGIKGNAHHQVDGYVRNVLINTHVIDSCQTVGVRKVVAMGSVAMYPDLPPGPPLREEQVWCGPAHSSEQGYGNAKRGLWTHLEALYRERGIAYALAISTNLYGPNDRFDTENGHVVPSLIKKFHDAKLQGSDVTVWGDGSAMRDFLFVEDAVRALLVMMDCGLGAMNLATGEMRSVRHVAETLAAQTGLTGRVRWDTTQPTGRMFSGYDISKLTAIGFRPQATLDHNLRATYDWYAANAGAARQ